MVNTPGKTLRRAILGLAPVAACMALLIGANAPAFEPPPPEPAIDSPREEAPQREIFIPFDDLHVILSGDVQRVFWFDGSALIGSPAVRIRNVICRCRPV